MSTQLNLGPGWGALVNLLVMRALVLQICVGNDFEVGVKGTHITLQVKPRAF